MPRLEVEVPRDRTNKQPANGFCRNPECQEDGQDEYRFEVHHARVECPKCGANQAPMIGLLVLTHLMIRDGNGPICARKAGTAGMQR